MSRLLKIVLFAIPSFFFVSVAAASIGALLVVHRLAGNLY